MTNLPSPPPPNSAMRRSREASEEGARKRGFVQSRDDTCRTGETHERFASGLYRGGDEACPISTGEGEGQSVAPRRESPATGQRGRRRRWCPAAERSSLRVGRITSACLLEGMAT